MKYLDEIKLKEFLNEESLFIDFNTWNYLDIVVEKIVQDAIVRTKSNHRKRVSAKDMDRFKRY